MAKRFKIKARVTKPNGTTSIIEPIGREAWALEQLVQAGPRGCTPITTPGPRWSAYTYDLRNDFNVNIETVEESHGGTFAGTHARYVLRDQVEILERSGGDDDKEGKSSPTATAAEQPAPCGDLFGGAA